MQTYSTTTSITYVRSSRDASRFYSVAENSRGYLECDCPAATFNRSKPCKHCRVVAKDGGGLVATPKGTPASLTHAPISDETRDRIAALDL